MTQTVRQMVLGYQQEIRQGDLSPAHAADLLLKLTALIGNCNAEILESELAYSTVLLKYLDSDEAANRAKIRAQVTPEYRRKREAGDTKELTVEMVRSLKFYLRACEEEMRLSR